MRSKVLVIDDDRAVTRGLCSLLSARGYDCSAAHDCAEALAMFPSPGADVALVDHRLPDGDAPTLMQAIRRVDEFIPLIVLTGHATIELAVQSMKLGAFNVLTKPVDGETLVVLIEKALDSQRMQRRDAVRGSARDLFGKPNPFVGSSKAIRKLEKDSSVVADLNLPVLIDGPTGSGKGVLARWIHDRSSRRSEAFVDLNCAGFGRDLLESELFGHARGAFTGATSAKVGLLEVAHRGTVFLDEIGDMDLKVQPRLLKAIEDKRFRRLGESEERAVDLRLIAASHRDLDEMMATGEFREDLYYRICAVRLSLPPLAERLEDVVPLAEVLLRQNAAETGRSKSLSADARERLTEYHWPGNVRELRNVVELAAALTVTEQIPAEAVRLPERHTLSGPPSEGAGGTLGHLRDREIEQALRREKGNIKAAAAKLGVSRSLIYKRLRAIGLDPSSFR